MTSYKITYKTIHREFEGLPIVIIQAFREGGGVYESLMTEEKYTPTAMKNFKTRATQKLRKYELV